MLTNRYTCLRKPFGTLTNRYTYLWKPFGMLTNRYTYLWKPFGMLTNRYICLRKPFEMLTNRYICLRKPFGMPSDPCPMHPKSLLSGEGLGGASLFFSSLHVPHFHISFVYKANETRKT